jgi:CBS domain-containing protein
MSTTLRDELLDDEPFGVDSESESLEPGSLNPQRLYEHLIREPIGKSNPRRAVSVNPHTSVADAVTLMKQHRFGCVLVESERRLVGIFTERDVLTKVIGSGRDPATLAVEEVMTPDPEALTMGDDIAWVLNLMAVGGFRHVPIVDDEGRPVAVFSVKDIVERLVDLFPHDVLNLPPHPGKDIAHTREGA